MRSLRVFQGFRDFDRKGGRTVDILRFDGGDTDLLQHIIHIYIEAYGDGIIVVFVDVNDEDDEDDEVVTVIGVSTLGC